MVNLSGLDAGAVGDMQNFDALPPGLYVCILTNSEQKATKDNTGQYLPFVAEVIDGAHEGRKHCIRVNLRNPNQTAVDIAHRELGAICKVVGIQRPGSSAELENKPLVV